jgi:hypothetical protein
LKSSSYLQRITVSRRRWVPPLYINVTAFRHLRPAARRFQIKTADKTKQVSVVPYQINHVTAFDVLRLVQEAE